MVVKADFYSHSGLTKALTEGRKNSRIFNYEFIHAYYVWELFSMKNSMYQHIVPDLARKQESHLYAWSTEFTHLYAHSIINRITYHNTRKDWEQYGDTDERRCWCIFCSLCLRANRLLSTIECLDPSPSKRNERRALVITMVEGSGRLKAKGDEKKIIHLKLTLFL